MPDGPDHPESWIFHMAMAWRGQVDDNLSYKERLALIKDKAKGLGDPARSAFLWMPDDTEVHKADISYWVPHAWNNHQGRLTLIGDAAHPMPPCKSFLIYFRWYLSFIISFQDGLSKKHGLIQPYVTQIEVKVSTIASATLHTCWKRCKTGATPNKHCRRQSKSSKVR